MALLRKYIKLYFDVNENILRDSDGNELRYSSFPTIAFAQQVIVNLQLVTDSSGTKYTNLEADQLYEASIDKEFDTPLMMVQTLNSGINQDGDWSTDGGSTWGNPDPTQGEISIRLNALTTGYKYKIRQLRERPGTHLELLVKNGAGEPVQVWEFPFRTLGILKSIPVESIEPTGNFEWFTDPGTGKQGLRIVNDDGEVLQVLVPAS